MNETSDHWPPRLAIRIDRACCDFENRLRAGEAPDLGDYLAGLEIHEQHELKIELEAILAAYADQRATGAYQPGTNPPPPHPAGNLVPSRYVIECELGRGGMGIVYRARDTQLNRTVALKLILAGSLADKQTLDRFQAEALAVAALSHPNVVQIHDTGEHGGNPFLVLEHVDGGTLASRIPKGGLDPTEAATILESLAMAVDSAHRAGIIHRDLKPANILFTTKGAPKISDFGLVKRLDSDSSRTRIGDFIGTPAYMSPEQAAGNARLVGPEADVYSLGAILFECLVGRPPFVGSSVPDVLRQVREDDPVPPRRIRPRVPADLESVCMKCLEKDPAHRYGGGDSLARDLRNFLSGKPTERPTSAWRKLEAELYAKNIALAERECAAGRPQYATPYLDACPAEWRGWEWRCLRGLLGQPLKLREHSDVVYGVTFSRDGRQIASVSDDHTLRIWDAETGRLVSVINDIVDQLYTPRFTPDGTRVITASQSGFVQIWDLANGVPSNLEGHSDVVVGIDLSPDGRWIASASDDTTVRIWDLESQIAVRVLHGHSDMVNAVAFSPDASMLASAGYDQTVRVWETRSGRELHRLDRHGGFVWTVAFSPDGKMLASAGGEGIIRIWNSLTGEEIHELAGHSGVIWSLAFTPDGTRLASAGWDKTVRLWDPRTGQEMVRFQSHQDAVNSIAFSPDGTILASASDDRTIALWVAKTEENPATPGAISLREGTGSTLGLSFSPDGLFLAAAGEDHIGRIWDVQNATLALRLNGHLALVGGVAHGPDGRLVATAGADKTVRLWSTQTGEELRVLRGHSDRIYGIAFSPDGRRLATGGWDRTIRIWDVETGETTRMMKGHSNWIWSVAYSPDGRRLASSGADRTVRVWHMNDDTDTLVLRGHELKVLGVAFSPDGETVASAGGDGIIKIWDISRGVERRSLAGHGDRVTGVVFHPGGRHLATSSEDQTVRVWDSVTGECVRIFSGHARTVATVAFNPRGDQLASAGADGSVRIWSITLPV